MDVTLDRINSEGFVFHKYEFPGFVLDEIESVPYFKDDIDPGMGGSGFEGNLLDFIPKSIEFYSNLVISLGLNEGHLIYDLERIDAGNYHHMHSHGIPAYWQCCIWIPTNMFSGREFLYGRRGEAPSKFKPELGDMVFFKPNDSDYVHGVTPLLSADPVFSIGITCGTTPQRFVACDSFAMEYDVRAY